MDQEEEKVKRKRVRKKIVEIDTIEKLNIQNSEKKPMIQNVINDDESYNNSYKKEDINQSQISFGKFNITVKKASTMTPEELRKYYNEKFEINESDKASKLIVQNDDNIVYSPIMDTDIIEKNVKKIESIKISKKIEKKYKMLSKFIDGIKEEWPEQTDIMCWWCCHNFEGCPIPCPVSYDIINDNYKANGVFCSWSCAAAYSIEKYTDITLLQQMKNELDLCNVGNMINIAPSKYILKNFGGHLSIKDFRNLTSDKNNNKKILISTEKISYINQDIVEMS
jgi:hypothetical protein